MVRKLIKYDFRSYFRLLLPVQLILIGIAGINRIVQLFEPPLAEKGSYGIGRLIFGDLFNIGGDGAYSAVFISSLVLYFISVAVCIIMTVIVAVVRFYQGMYTREGYLNHTLPVTPTQHIAAKLLTSLIFALGTMFSVFLSFTVLTLGDVNVEIYKALFYLFGQGWKNAGGHMILYTIEVILRVLSFCIFVYIKLYCCISIGQLVNKLKILLAFGVFFGIFIVKQIIYTVLSITLFMNLDLMEKINEWILENGIAYTHISLCWGIFFNLVLGLVYFLITKHIMSKKLNLS